MERKLPPIPSQMFSTLGPLPVEFDSWDEDVAGEVELFERRVRIKLGLDPVIEWQTYWHEAVHVALFDSGLHNQLPRKLEESICDAIGNYLAAALRAGYIEAKEVK